MQNRREDIDLLGDAAAIRFWQSAAWMKKEQRNAIMAKGVQIFGSLQFLSVVSGDDEEGIRIPRLLASGAKELFHGIIGVGNRLMDRQCAFFKSAAIFLRNKIRMMGAKG